MRTRRCAHESAAVVGGGFGVDEEAGDFGGVEFEGAFERGDDGVDVGHWEVVGQGAVAVDLNSVAAVIVVVDAFVAGDAGDEDLVDVEDLGEGRGYAAEADFELAVAFERGGTLDGGGLAFDVGEDGGDFGDFAADFGL